MKTEEQIKALFILAGFEVLKIWKLANKYWGDVEDYKEIARENPWWLIKTDYGLIEIGPRKHVYEIDWEETEIRKIVTEKNVTKGETFVHAYSVEDALKYLKILIN